MTENVETTEEQLTIEDILEGADKTPFHPVLQVWKEVLDASQTVRKEKINPQWALRVVQAHTEVTFNDMPTYRDAYYGRIDQLIEALHAEIDGDDECFNVTSPEEDNELNSVHYLNILFTWQKAILGWELDWDCTSPDAGVQLASIIEVHKMFFGEVGLVSLLDQINFEFPETVQEQLMLELEELKKNWAGDE